LENSVVSKLYLAFDIFRCLILFSIPAETPSSCPSIIQIRTISIYSIFRNYSYSILKTEISRWW